MNKGIIVIGIILLAIMGVVLYQYTVSSSGKHESQGWSESTSPGVGGENKSMEGKWGVELIAGYTDGSEDSLTDFSLEVKFREKEVSYFKYKLYTSATGNGYSNCSVDLTGFDVVAVLTDSNDVLKWSSNIEPGDTHTVPLSGEWKPVYEITVSASRFELPDGEFNLEFIPEGSIYVRGIPDGNTHESGLPKGESIDFSVEINKWINVEFSSGT